MKRSTRWLGALALVAAVAACDGGAGAHSLGPAGPRTKAGTPIPPVTAASDLAVVINGDTTIPVNYTCPYFADASGGTGIYNTYTWSISGGTGSGGADEFNAKRTSAGSFTLTVTVTDSGGNTATGTLTVSVGNYAPCQS